jgi:hypothetical protein
MPAKLTFAGVLCAALGICAAWAVHTLIRRLHLTHTQPVKKTHSTVQAIKTLLAPPNMSLADMLASRAIANARLVNVFHLTNTFVSTRLETHSAFRKSAIALLQDMSRNGGWPRWVDVASQAVYLQLPSSPPDIPFDRFIQAVTFRTIVAGLLNPAFDQTSFNPDDITFVTSTINTLWDHSKRPQLLPTSLLVELNAKLRLYFPDEDVFPNPLDFIIPSWETLWRLVATTMANVHQNHRARGAFLRFRKESNVETFRRWVDAELSVEAVMIETLRLHPPTKRIARILPKGRSMAWPRWASWYPPSLCHADGYKEDVADIEAVQRSVVWSALAVDAGLHTGTDIATFNPARHRARTDSQSETLMAFSFGRLGCIAKEWAPIAAGLIVAAVLGEVDEEAYEVIPGPTIGGRVGWDGWFIRRKHAQIVNGVP